MAGIKPKLDIHWSQEISISDCDQEKYIRQLEVYWKYLKKLREDFKVHFIKCTYLFDLEIDLTRWNLWYVYGSCSKIKSIGDYWSNVNTIPKYPKIGAAGETFLFAPPSLYMHETGLSHTNAILIKQWNKQTLKDCGDLQLKLTNFQPNINALATIH